MGGWGLRDIIYIYIYVFEIFFVIINDNHIISKQNHSVKLFKRVKKIKK